MATATNPGHRTRQEEPLISKTLLTEIWFVLAIISIVIHVHLGMAGLTSVFTEGTLSDPLTLFYLAAAIGLLAVIIGAYLHNVPDDVAYLGGFFLSGAMLFAFVDYHALGVFWELMGIEPSASGGAAAGVLVDTLLENPLALVSKVSEAGLFAIFTVLLANEFGVVNFFGSSAGANATSATAGSQTAPTSGTRTVSASSSAVNGGTTTRVTSGPSSAGTASTSAATGTTAPSSGSGAPSPSAGSGGGLSGPPRGSSMRRGNDSTSSNAQQQPSQEQRQRQEAKRRKEREAKERKRQQVKERKRQEAKRRKEQQAKARKRQEAKRRKEQQAKERKRQKAKAQKRQQQATERKRQRQANQQPRRAGPDATAATSTGRASASGRPSSNRASRPAEATSSSPEAARPQRPVGELFSDVREDRSASAATASGEVHGATATEVFNNMRQSTRVQPDTDSFLDDQTPEELIASAEAPAEDTSADDEFWGNWLRGEVDPADAPTLNPTPAGVDVDAHVETGGRPPDGEWVPKDIVAEVVERTVTEVFTQLRSSGAVEFDPDAVLADDSPEDLIASADEPESADPHDDLLADAEAIGDDWLTEDAEDDDLFGFDDGTVDDDLEWIETTGDGDSWETEDGSGSTFFD